MTECSTRDHGPETCVTLAMQGPFDQMPAAFGRVYGWLEEHGHQPRGMPVTVYLDDPAAVAPADARWEIRAPIEPDAPERDADGTGIAVRRIAAVRVAATTHQGPYEEVGPAYAALMAWIAEQGLEVAGPPMEAYLNDPGETAPEACLTEIMVPVGPRTGTPDRAE